MHIIERIKFDPKVFFSKHIQKFILVTGFVFFLIKISFSQVEPRLVLPVGHTGTLMNMDISYDEKYIIFSSFDGSISLWDYQSQKILKKFIHSSGKSVKCKFIKNSYDIITFSDAIYGGKIDNTIKIWSINQEDRPIKVIDLSSHVAKNIDDLTFTQNKDLIIVETPNRFNDSLIFLNIKTDEVRKIPRIEGFSEIISVLNNRIIIETLLTDKYGVKIENDQIKSGLSLLDFDGNLIDFYEYGRLNENFISTQVNERISSKFFKRILIYSNERGDFFIDSLFLLKIEKDRFKKDFLLENKYSKNDSCYYFNVVHENQFFYTLQSNQGQKHFLYKNGKLQEVFKDDGLKVLMKYQNTDFGDVFTHFFYSNDSVNYFLYQNKLFTEGKGFAELESSNEESGGEFKWYLKNGYYYFGNGKFFYNDNSNIKLLDFNIGKVTKEFSNKAIFQTLNRIGENYFLYTSYLSYDSKKQYKLLKNDFSPINLTLSFLGEDFQDEIVQLNDSILIAVDSNVIYRININNVSVKNNRFSSFYNQLDQSNSKLFIYKDLIFYSSNLFENDTILVFNENNLHIFKSFQGKIVEFNEDQGVFIIQSIEGIFYLGLPDLKVIKQYPNYEYKSHLNPYIIENNSHIIVPEFDQQGFYFQSKNFEDLTKNENPPTFIKPDIEIQDQLAIKASNKDWIYYQINSNELKGWNRKTQKYVSISNKELEFVTQLKNEVYFISRNEDYKYDSIFVFKQSKNKIKFSKSFPIPLFNDSSIYYSFYNTPQGLVLISDHQISLMKMHDYSITWSKPLKDIENRAFNSTVLYLTQRISTNNIIVSYLDFGFENSLEFKELCSMNIPKNTFISFVPFNQSIGGILSYSSNNENGIWKLQKQYWASYNGIADFNSTDEVISFSKSDNFLLLKNSTYNCSKKIFTSLPVKWNVVGGELSFINDTLLTDGHSLASILDTNFFYYTRKTACKPKSFYPAQFIYLNRDSFLQYQKNNNSTVFYRIDNSKAKIHRLIDGKMVYCFFYKDTAYAIFRDLEKDNNKFGFQKKTYLSLVNLNSGNLVNRIEIEVFEDFNTSFFKFDSKNQTIYYHPFNGKIYEFNFSTFHVNKVYQGHRDWINSFNFYNDSMFVTTSSDYNLHVWKNNKTKPLYSRIQVGENDYLYYDEHYRFDGTPGAIEKLYFVCGLEVVELNQVKDSLYVPNLVQRIMNGENLDRLPKLSDLNICGVTPIVEPIDKGDKGYHYEITPRTGGAGDIEIYLNGVVRQTENAKRLKLKNGKYSIQVDPKLIERYQIPGESLQVKVIAKTANNSISSRGVVLDLESDEPTTLRKPSLHAVMIGVDDYKDDNLDLNYAAKDANDLHQALEQASKKFFNVDDTNRVFFYNLTRNREGKIGTDKIKGKTPDKANIIQTLEEIEKKSKPEDILLVFFAGHGEIVDKDQLLLLTTEATSANFEGIRMRELLEQLNKIPAGKRVLILDACHSGAAINNMDMAQLTGKRDVKDAERQSQRLKELDKLASKSGFAIITASSSDQKALELPQYEHGLMTYALLNAMLNNKSSLDENNQLQLDKWLIATEEEVKKLNQNQSAERMVPVTFTLGKIDEEVRSSIVLKEIPTVFVDNVLNKNTFNDNLKIKYMLSSAFQEMSRGSDSQIMVADFPNAVKVNILYEEKGDELKANISLYKENFEQKFELTGKKANISAFVQELMNQIRTKIQK